MASNPWDLVGVDPMTGRQIASVQPQDQSPWDLVMAQHQKATRKPTPADEIMASYGAPGNVRGAQGNALSGLVEDPRVKAWIEKSMKSQEGDISSMGKLAQLYAAKPSQLDLSPLAALSDSLTPGGKLLQGYERPEGMDARLKTAIGITDSQRKGRAEIVDSLNKQLFNKGYLELMKAQTKQGDELQKEAADYSKRTENLPSLKYSLDQLDRLVPDEGDIPGVGATGWVPSSLLTSEGSQIRQSARDAMKAKMYLTTGKTANDSEADAGLKSIGLSWDSSDREFKSGVKNLKESIRQEIQQKEAGYKPAAIEMARSRGSLTTKDFDVAPSAGKKEMTMQERAEKEISDRAEKLRKKNGG